MKDLVVDCDAGTVTYSRCGKSRIAGCVTNGGYRQLKIDGKSVLAHRFIWETANGSVPNGLFVDHINGKRDDNRIANLRLVTAAQNAENKFSAQVNSKSAIKGVHWCPRIEKWRAMIQTKGKLYALGSFLCKEEASKAYAVAAKRFHTHNPHAA